MCVVILKCSVLSLVLLASPLAWAGIDSGGADNPSSNVRAGWFYGRNRQIQACIEVAPDFGLSPAQLKDEVVADWQTWVTYVQRKEIYADSSVSGSDPNFHFTTALLVSEKCTGKEDLSFIFGTDTPEIRMHKAQHERPFGFAVKTAFNSGQRWSRGFVWIAPSKSIRFDDGGQHPDWGSPRNLRAMVLHEMGHVFGCLHVEGTIMSEHIGDMIRQGPNSYTGFGKIIPAIDLGRELYRGKYARTSYQGRILPQGHALMDRLAGRPVEDKAKLSLRLYDGAEIDRVLKPALQIQDEYGTIALAFSPGRQLSSGVQQSVFKDAYGRDRKNDSRIIYAKLLLRDGQGVIGSSPSVIIEYNQSWSGGKIPSSNDATIRLVSLSDGEPVDIAVFDEIQFASDK